MNAMILLILMQAGPLVPVPAPIPPEESPVEVVADSRKLYVIHDDGRESRMLVSELNRNWLKYGREEEYMIAVNLLAHVELVNKNNDKTFRMLSGGYPYWRYGERGKLNRFDERTFADTTRPLMTLRAIWHNQTCDLKPWTIECEQLQQSAECTHVTAVFEWLLIAAPDRRAEFVNAKEWGLADNIRFVEMERELANYVNYPVFIPPAMPVSPLKPMPWEVDPRDTGDCPTGDVP